MTFSLSGVLAAWLITTAAFLLGATLTSTDESAAPNDQVAQHRVFQTAEVEHLFQDIEEDLHLLVFLSAAASDAQDPKPGN
jgi:hypothetical protein